MENTGKIQYTPNLWGIFLIREIKGMSSCRQILTHLHWGWHDSWKVALVVFNPLRELL